MRTFKKNTVWLMTILLLNTAQVVAETTLDLKQAEKLAVERDAVLRMKRAESQAHYERSVAADTLPDPRIKLGLLNYPTDTFDRDQEPMTRTQVAIQQMFPRGNTLELKSRRLFKIGDASSAAALNQEQMVVMQVRSVYLELLYWIRAEEVVKQNKKLFRNLVRITELQYASGVQRQQDVIRAGLELDMLDDRLDDIKTKQQQTQAKLAKLTGTDVQNNNIDSQFPQLAEISMSDDYQSQLKNHPKVMVEDARVASSQYGVELARQSYKPEWMFELGYGFRSGTNPNGSDRADFASAMISFDIPLFTKDKQDRQVAASKLRYQARVDAREEIIRELNSEYGQVKANYLQLQTRLQRFENIIVPQSEENAKAALLAYQSRRGDFTSLMRARITELETNLKLYRLNTNLLKSQARLLYLVGETQ